MSAAEPRVTRRKLNALRALAERPGTPAEGEVARRMLAKMEAVPCEANPLGKFAQFMRSGSMDDLASAVGRSKCACGATYAAFSKCSDYVAHERIRAEIRQKFPKDTRVFYNMWAYERNAAARVTGYPRDPKLWNWVSVKFDHLKSYRSIPVLDSDGWHLSTEPLTKEQARPLRGNADFVEDATPDEIRQYFWETRGVWL